MGAFGTTIDGRSIALSGEPLFPGFDRKEFSKADKDAARSQNYFKDRTPSITLRNQIQLSTYGDAIGGDLEHLKKFVDEHLGGALGSVHLLPIYPSSGDRGFAPLTYHQIDPEQGSWDDVRELGKEYDLVLDFMLNHVSAQSKMFKDYLAKGEKSEYASMFMDWDKFWGEGGPGEKDLASIITHQGDLPMIEVTLEDGSKRRLWNTFGPEQIDIDPKSPAGWNFVTKSIKNLCSHGVKVIRLDAFGCFTKKAGSECYFEEPEVFDMLDRVGKLMEESGTRLLCEVHQDYRSNLKIAERGYWVYDFSLPLLVHHAFHFQTALNLRKWLHICPRRQVTTLDTHDGMGIDDVTGLADICDLQELESLAKGATTQDLAAITKKYFYDPKKASYVDAVHQINSTYYSACEEDDLTYLLARAIQFFCPGVPLVYYNGMLAGVNDADAVRRTGVPRNINRPNYSYEDAAKQMQRPVVQALRDLCRFRNQHPAFQGQITIFDDEPEHVLKVRWANGKDYATLTANIKTRSFDLRYTTGGHESSPIRCVRFQREGGQEGFPEGDFNEEDVVFVCAK
ncbi:sucrose phosphorylase [Klebsormidium nitens]|uniref:Sucrose phosphorylase n=1 Tax=Klebsormidium nitens TaxID=105231 RepID=A0A1Y1I0P8_KLENI|nr:sucrose phosphorylase [Klebsormidium nitens]|eukprot:GAQ84023.1 sucrose phosphorylase [Klebsormidium nitens]